MSDSELEKGIANGSIIEGEYTMQQQVGSGAYDTRDIYVKALLHICKSCQKKHRTLHKNAPNVKAAELTSEQESAEIQKLLNHVRNFFPEWTLEMCAREAVERYNDVSKIKDAGFREYLIHADRL
jgi:hypothetical protein